jgi:Rrf2 family protein
MAFFGTHIEYGLHTLVWLAVQPLSRPSSRELAELQKIPAAFLAKILAKFEKAGLVEATDGMRGGYRLARDPGAITVLQAVVALDGKRALFDCQEIRKHCALWEGEDAPFPIGPVCGIQSVMLQAERAMRAELAKVTIEQLSRGAYRKAPSDFRIDVQNWLARQREARDQRRVAAVKASSTRT